MLMSKKEHQQFTSEYRFIIASENSDLLSNEFVEDYGADFSNPTVLNGILVNVTSTITYHNPDLKFWNEVVALGKAGKGTVKK